MRHEFYQAAGFILTVLNSCSSTTTETADTVATSETVTSDMAAKESNNSATGSDTTASSAVAGNLSEDPTNFILLAGSIDLLETRTSNQALAKAKNPEVRNFAQQVLSDHSNITRELRGLATGKELKYPTDLLEKHQLLMNRLMEERTKDFDKTYMEVQESAHIELEELFEDASKRHRDPEMQAFASRNLETLRMQLESTKKVKDMVD